MSERDTSDELPISPVGDAGRRGDVAPQGDSTADEPQGADGNRHDPIAAALERVAPAAAGSKPMDIEERHVLAAVTAGLFERPAPRLMIDRYQLQERIGAGGMGVVYAAIDPELGRRVAIKLVRARGPAEAAARLLREAQAIARISHPHVIPVHDVGTYDLEAVLPDDGPPQRGVFVVMELVAGRDLAEWLRSGSRSPAEILEVFLRSAEGLAAAHDAGVVHRDFKPANVLVGDDGRPRVLDFGLARTTSESEASLAGGVGDPLPSNAITQDGAVLGTPLYMAPEQLRGEVADARSDQYAFAVGLWTSLCGRPPFPHAAVERMLERKLVGAIAPPPSGKLAPQLQRVLERALSPLPDQRFASMRALAEAIEQSLRPRSRRGAWAVGLAASALVMWRVVAGDSEPTAAAPPAANAAAAAEVPGDAAAEVPHERRRLAFLPFEDRTGLERMDFTRDGLPSLIFADLAQAGGTHIDPRLLRIEHRRTPRPWIEVARDLGATHVVSGVLERGSGDEVRVHIELLAARGEVVAQWDRTAGAERVPAITREIAADLSVVHLGRTLAPTPSPPLDFDRSLQLGIAALELGDHHAARQHLAEASVIDGDSAELHFYSAVVSSWSDAPPEVALAEIELAERGPLGEAQVAFLGAYRSCVLRDWPASEAAFRAAIARHGNDPFLLYGLFEVQYHGGRPLEALATFRQLQEVSPRMVLGLQHLFEFGRVTRDAALITWVLERSATRDPTEAAAWGALWEGDNGHYAAAITGLDLYAGDPEIHARHFAAQTVLYRLLSGHSAFVGEWVAQLEPQRSSHEDLAVVASLYNVRGDARGIASSRRWARRRVGDADATFYRTEAWISLAMSEYPDLDDATRREYDEQIASSVLPSFAGNAFVASARALLGGVDPHGGPMTAVAAITAARQAEARGDPAEAAEHMRRAIASSIDARLMVVESYEVARLARAAGDHAAVLAACQDVTQPVRGAWGWGAALGPCLVWSAEAAAAMGDRATARARLERLLELRDAAPQDDKWRVAARTHLAALAGDG